MSLPADPASDRKHNVCAVSLIGRSASDKLRPETVFVNVTSDVGINHHPLVVL